MKRFVCVCLALLLALPLASCAPSGPSGKTLTVMGRRSDLEKSYLNKAFDLYEQQTGNQLERIAFEDAQFEADAVQAFQNGEAPDVFLHFHNADLNRFDVAADFLPLNDQPWAADLTDSARDYCTDRDGNLLGLPFWESSVSGCYYNKTILDSLGLKPAATQAEFDVLCQALCEIGYTPLCWPADGCTWMFQFGLDPIFADDPALLERLNRNEIAYADIPQVQAMVQWVADAAQKGWFGPDYLETGWSDIAPQLSQGDAVMTLIWDTWFTTDFAQSGPYGPADFALMPVFMGTADGGTYEGGNLNMMMVNQNGPNVQDALDFLAFCAQPETVNAAFEGIATVSCFRSQTANIQSQMVTDARDSIDAHERVSTAASRIVGYSADDVSAAFDSLLRGRTDVPGCVALMDDYRIREAKAQGTEGF